MSRRAPRKPRQVKRGSFKRVMKYWLRHTDFTERELRALLLAKGEGK